MADGTDVFVTVEASEATVSVVAQPVISDAILQLETLDVVVNVTVEPAETETVLVEGGSAPSVTIITPEAEAALAEIELAVAEAEAAKDAAAASEAAASASQALAAASATAASGFADDAETSALQARQFRDTAAVHVGESEAARDAAAGHAGAAATQATAAASSASSANTAKDAAEAARDAALAAQAGTEGAEALVEAHKVAAEAAAANAAASETAAAASASAASISAYEADVKSAQAEQSRVAAVQAKNDAEAAETGAASSATAAAGSATSAASSATSANTSATGAATSAGAAAGSATASAASATQAADSATAAGESAADALAAKEAAETASATSATSATNAAASATSAASSAAAAATSAANAAASETAAEAAQAAAEAARDEILGFGPLPAQKTWVVFASEWDFPPAQIATIGAGTVWRYRLDGVSRYRLVPTPYSALTDAFYEAFDGTTLTGLIDTRGTNAQPVANAGVDQSVDYSTQVTLTAASSSDADPDDTLTYLWTQTSGPTVTLSSATAAQPTFTAPALTSSDLAQDLVFSLTVTDELGSSTVDTVTITVNPPPNQAPTANAGPDQTRDEGTLVTLDGRGSTDPDIGDVLSYFWTQISGPAVTLSDATAAQPTFTAPLVASTEPLVFSLVVTDDKGNSSAPDTVTITVQDVAPANNPPQASAYWNNNTDPGGMTNDTNELIRLSADLSYDPDGDPLSYFWTQTAGTPVSLFEGVGPQDQFFYVPSLAMGETLSFQVTVSDNRGGSASATVDVVVEADPMFGGGGGGGGGGGYDTLTGGTAGPGGGSAPVAYLYWFNRADNSTNAWGGSEIILAGDLSYDPDGHSMSYTFTQTAGTPVDLREEPISPNWASFIAPNVQMGEWLTFTLTVSDGVTSSTASVDIWVNP